MSAIWPNWPMCKDAPDIGLEIDSAGQVCQLYCLLFSSGIKIAAGDVRMTLNQLIKTFGIPAWLLDKSREPCLKSDLEALYKRCVESSQRFQVEVDNSPVMASPDSFAARVDYKTHLITLNGFVLAQTSDTPIVRDFLIFHELAHEFAKSPLFNQDLDEEETCDLLALYALQKKNI